MKPAGRGEFVAKVGAVAAALLVVGLALTGCIQGPATSGATPSHGTSSPSPAPSPTEKPSVTPTPSGGTISTTCDRILTADQVYAYNPNVVADSAYAPAPGSIAAGMKANSGLACGWVNETSGVELEVSLSLPNASDLAAAKAAAERGTAVPSTTTDAAYFSVAAGVGRVQLFQGRYWIAVASADFSGYADATPVYDAVVTNLRSAGG